MRNANSDTQAMTVIDDVLSIDEQQLLAAGDAACWETTYRRIHQPLFGYCMRISGNEARAHDLAHEAFVRTIKRCRDHGTPDGLKAYLFTTARNIHWDSEQKSQRQAATTVDDLQEVISADDGIRGDEPAAHALVSEQQDDVRQALLELSDRQRLALAMCDIEGLTYAEIASSLDLAENAVAQLVFRARARMRLALRMRQVRLESLPVECQKLVPAISSHIDGQLGGTKRDLLEAHLALCESCQRTSEDFMLVQHRYRAFAPVGLLSSDDAWANIEHRADEQSLLSESPGSQAFIARHRIPVAVITAVVCAITITAIATGGTAGSLFQSSEHVNASRTTASTPADIANKSTTPNEYSGADDSTGDRDSAPVTTTTTPDTDSGSGPPPATPPSATPPPPPTTYANLIPTSIVYSGNQVIVTVSNTGDANADASTLQVTIGASSLTTSLSAIPAGSSAEASVNSGCVEGTLQITAVVDYSGAVSESNEGDNSTSESASNIC